MGRPPLPIGTHGIIRTYKTPRGVRAQTTYRDLDGVTRYVECHRATKTRAVNDLREKLKARRVTATADGGVTADTRVEDLAAIWWKAFSGLDRSPGTRRAYRTYLDQDIIPKLGRLRIRETSVMILDNFITGIADTHGKGAAKTCRTVLSGMYGLAVRHGALDANPVRDIASVTVKSKPARALTLDQARDLRAKLRTDPRAVERDLPDLTDMMLATGMRIGEALALTWDALHLDTDEPYVEIRGTLVRDDENGLGLHIKPEPKTEAGFRTLAVPSWCAAMLRDRRPPDAEPTDLVFPTPGPRGGTLRDPTNAGNDLREAFDKAGCTWVTSHVYRKTVATMMDQHGCTAREAADQLGHAKISMTQNVYFGRNRTSTKGAKVMEVIAQPPDTADTSAAPKARIEA